MEVVAPKVGGVEGSDGKPIAAKHMIDGGPSVLFDVVVLLLSEEGAEHLAKEVSARDFVADAFAHLKLIAFTPGALPLLNKAGIASTAISAPTSNRMSSLPGGGVSFPACE